MPRNLNAPLRKACFHCGRWIYGSKGIEHDFNGTVHRVHGDCHRWLLRREKTLARPVEEKPKELVFSDMERDALALYVQLKGNTDDVLLEIARYMHTTQPSINAALHRCQEKFNQTGPACVNREQLKARALAAGYGEVNQEHIA